MLHPNLDTDLDLAKQAAKLASELLIKTRNNSIKVNSNIDKDIKLQADEDSERLIINFLAKNTSYNILTEESGNFKTNNSEYCWIIDPLDGSLNYSRNIDLYCISIGLWYNNEPLLGVIYDFHHDNLYCGIVGKGAWCNSASIEVSHIASKNNSIIATGFPVYTDFGDAPLLNFVKNLQQYKKVRLFGSAALSLMLVAQGSIEAYAEDNIALWDVAAGLAIVKAAKGRVEYNPGKSNNYLKVIATNNHI